MCDEAKLKVWAADIVSRRQFGVLTGAAAVAACAPGEVTSEEQAGSASTTDLSESAVTFETADGTMDAFFVHPSEGKHPGVLFWPDIGSLRESKRNMARRLAGEGYAVLVLNPYYRDVVGQQFTDFADFISQEGFQKVRPWREKLNADTIGSDATAAVAWLDTQDAVDTTRGIGSEGYCMGGPFTIWSAAAVPGRVKAAAPFHAGGLVREDYDKSPHKLLGSTEASFLIGIAQDDDAEAPNEKTALREAADAAGRPAAIEVFAGDHGWTVPDSPVYAEAEAERAYAAKLKLYSESL